MIIKSSSNEDQQIIFQQGLGLDSETSRILSGGALTWKFLSCFVAFFTIDRFGRRKLFMFSGAGMASCMLALAVASSFPKTNQSAQIASALFVFLFNFFIPIGFLGANFLYCTEVAPTRLRVPMAGISTAVSFMYHKLYKKHRLTTPTEPLALELRRQHGHARRYRNYRLAILPRLPYHLGHHLASCLLRLPGDHGSQSRGAGDDVHRGNEYSRYCEGVA